MQDNLDRNGTVTAVAGSNFERVPSPAEAPHQVRAAARALDLLAALAEFNGPIDLATLARSIDVHQATAFRLLETLRVRRLVVRAAEGGYALGPRLIEWGNASLRRVSIWNEAQQTADSLASASGETAMVGVLDANRVLYVAIAHPQRTYGIESLPGSRHPVHCSALGKAIIAYLPHSTAVELLGPGPLERLTDNTIVDLGQLYEDLERTRQRGYSIDNGERVSGVYCIGAPIRDHTGEVIAAVSVVGPAFRTARDPQALAELVQGFAATASQSLGFRL